jgi:hypothetical protein
MPNSSHLDDSNGDLHAFVDESIRTIQFRVVSRGRIVHVDVREETVNSCFGVRDMPSGLLLAYEAHRSEIDAAVIRRAAMGGTGVVSVRPLDIVGEAPT